MQPRALNLAAFHSAARLNILKQKGIPHTFVASAVGTKPSESLT